MEEKKKRGRPLGSGVKNYCSLGCRLTENEYFLIKECLKKLKKKYGSNDKIILKLFKKYKNAFEKKEIESIKEEYCNDKTNRDGIGNSER
ncbi:hypothetical protein [Fusobacterium sp.]|uniref:hypothetical protein n=1 Tax=Fusobacterium sp. TaxID=68766 RepID=UPI0028FFDE3F|nr:hypothetical protein [Fusobacterium sp.]MDU1911037.1 hypothetical protein [Fusobacterium sp.]